MYGDSMETIKMDIECSLAVQCTPHYQKGHGLKIPLDAAFLFSLFLLVVFPKQVPREGATLLAFLLKIA